MRPRQLRRLYTLMGLGAILTGATLGIGIAKADSPDVCASLAAHPTVGTVEELVANLWIEGIPPGDAGEFIAVVVMVRA